ncbi:MAG: hypothetical protein FWF46_01100 [Oscillospiraceae bacterium]|nr:hypothetical protein [Oscillospiraceae bacterium]
MEILTKKFNEIEYYLIDTYETEFSFGVVYHFVSDNDEKFCFYQNDNYIPIENESYLTEIEKELKIDSDVLFRENSLQHLGNIKTVYISASEQRLTTEEEYQLCDTASKIINELFPNISYKYLMNVLNDGSGIYYDEINDDGAYDNTGSKKIYINSKYDESSNNSLSSSEKMEKARISLHEGIHKVADRSGFAKNIYKEFAGLIEGGTEKICEDKYGDKNSHTYFEKNINIQFNFSREASYKFPQVIYRQMAQLVPSGMADESIINGDEGFFIKFKELYGDDLFEYANHRANRLLKKDLPEKQKLRYIKEAQAMILTKAFDKKLSTVQTEEDMINYMTELRNFEYVTARISEDDTYKNYYNSKYNFIMQLAQQKGMEISKLEQFQYFEVQFYPLRDCEMPDSFKIAKMHIQNLSGIKEIDLSKCTRMQIKDSPYFYNLDVIFQEGKPISIIKNDFASYISCIEDDEYIDIIKQQFGINDNEIKIYNIDSNTYIFANTDGTSEIYSKNHKTNEICTPTKNQIDLGINSKDIEEARKIYYAENQTDAGISCNEIEGTAGYVPLFSKFKNFFSNLLNKHKTSLLPEASTQLPANSRIDNTVKSRDSFIAQLKPDNPIYDYSTVMPIKMNDHITERTISDSKKIEK